MEEQLFIKFEKLRSATLKFTRSIETEATPIWLAGWHSEHSNSLESLLMDVWYHEDQDGRETRIYPGLVGLSRAQVTYANEINLLKDEFRDLIQKIKTDQNAEWREIQGRLAKRYRFVNEALSREGLNRLHLKQVFRHIPLLLKRPAKVGFSWYTSGRSIKKISKKEALDLLHKLNMESAHIKIQLQRLASIQDSEPLARVQKQAPVLRANAVFADNKRRSLNVSLPLMFPNEGKQTLPEFNVPPTLPPNERQRLVRNDIKIEDEPFLPSIRVHQYRGVKKNSFY
jgi:hypothetical protein